jgi:hypothetical protein
LLSKDAGEPPKDTEIENEKGVRDVRTLGVNDDTSDDSGLKANGMIQKIRRGTASHNTELSDERADLWTVLDVLAIVTSKYNVPISSL